MGALLPRLRVTKIVQPLGRILVPGFVGSPPIQHLHPHLDQPILRGGDTAQG